MPTIRRTNFLGKSLEDAFLYQMDDAPVAEFQRALSLEEKIEAFQNATGIRNRRQLVGLIDAGFEVSTLTAFLWVPLVFVAWADGEIDEREKEAIFDTLIGKGIAPEAVAIMTEHEWFCQRPNGELWDIWRQFTLATLDQQPITLRNELMDEIVTLCHVVANASGNSSDEGFISEQEWRVIDRVAESLCALTAVS